MKFKMLLFSMTAALLLTGCAAQNQTAPAASSAQDTTTTAPETDTAAETLTESPTEAETETETDAATEHETAPQETVGFEGMEAVYADALHEGTYEITVDSSSSMFNITACELTVADGTMTARINTGSTSYDAMFLGTEEAAAAAEETIPFEEIDGERWFTLPVAALDSEITCASLSRKKQEWYGRTLVFRADSLPEDAFTVQKGTPLSALSLADGSYTVEVKLEGGSGKASVQSPAVLTIADGAATAEIRWSSNKYDYMIVGGEQYLPVSTEDVSVFEIPVSAFDTKLSVKADTTAMSTPHEIDYTLYFDAATIQ